MRPSGSDFCFFNFWLRAKQNLLSRPQRQAGPHIEHSQYFPHNIQCVAGISPPMGGIEFVVGDATHGGMAVCGRKLFPKGASSSSVYFGSDDDDRGGLTSLHALQDGANLVRGVFDGWFKNANGGFWHALLHEK